MQRLVEQIQRVVPLHSQAPRRPLTTEEAARLLSEDLRQKRRWLKTITPIQALDPVRRDAVLFLLQVHGEATVFSNPLLMRAIRRGEFDHAPRYLPAGIPREHRELLKTMFEEGEYPE